MQATAEGRLGDVELKLDPQSAGTVMMVSGGYRGSYEKGFEINGLDQVNEAVVFHAGTRLDKNGNVVTDGGRVLAVTALNADFRQALAKAYEGLQKIGFKDAYYRRDIGFDL